MMLKSGTNIVESPKKKLNVKALMEEMVTTTPTTIELDAVSHWDLFQVKQTETVGAKQEHDVIIGDNSATAKVTLWMTHQGMDSVTDFRIF